MATWISRIGWKTRVLLGLTAVIAVLVVAWDWNWFRHPVEQYFIDRSHRQVRIGDLHVSFNEKLEPTVRLRDLEVENAPWADSRPFVKAREVAFTFALRSITERRPIVSKLVLVDAEVDLERQADGHRNWRLRNPENVARGRMKVVRLEARNTRIRFIRRDNHFEVTAASTPLGSEANNSAGPLTTRIRFEGTVNEAPFEGEAQVGDFLTLMESDESFPIRGHLATGKSRMEVDGRLANLFRPSTAEGKVRLSGPSLARLHPFLPAQLPESKAYDIEAVLRQEGDAMTASDLHAKIGGTVLTGMLSLDRTLDPPLLKAHLQSNAADLADLTGPRRTEPVPGKPAASDEKERPSQRLFSKKEFPLDRLGALDAEVSLNLKKLRAEGFPGLESFKAEAQLKAGVLEVKPDVGLAEGHLAGTVRVDGRSEPATLQVKVDGRDVRLEKLLAGRKLQGTAAGPMEAHVNLKAQGNSVAAMAGSLDGSIRAGMQNGVISGLLAATLELNLGKILKALISGNKPIGIVRVDTAFDFENGKGNARVFFVDTEQTRVVGTGSIDLRDESLDLVLTPHPKRKGLFALDSAIRVQGPMRQPEIGIEKKERDG